MTDDLISLIINEQCKQNQNYSDDSCCNEKYMLIVPQIQLLEFCILLEIHPRFLSGHARMRGKNNGKYPYRYLEMLENIFSYEPNTIEVLAILLMRVIRKIMDAVLQ